MSTPKNLEEAKPIQVESFDLEGKTEDSINYLIKISTSDDKLTLSSSFKKGLICKEYFLDDEVSPGEQMELALEFLKNQKENLKQPYITSLRLHIHPKDYDPMLVLDFNESYNNKNIPFVGPEVEEKEDNKMIKINDVQIFDETKGAGQDPKGGKIEIKKKGKTVIKKKIKTKVFETDSGPKEMTPFQRRIYELNQREKERVEKEKERQQKSGWKKNVL